jgi:DNA-directed RNA polymerase subunit N
MLIPPRCFTCGEILADKWTIYIKTVNEKKNNDKSTHDNNELDIEYIDTSKPSIEKSIEGKILDDLGLHKYCCRLPFLSTVHLITEL